VFPENATPHDRAIIFAFQQGYRTPKEIKELYGYRTVRPVEKVFKKHKGKFENIKIPSRQTRYAGGHFIIP